MKKIQTGILKSPGMVLVGLMVCFSLSAQPNQYLTKADTLFKRKQFTQSFELYEDLFKQKKYSPSMLLKMAYIQEGMGHVSLSLYYLTLYYKVSHDERALAKIEEVAANNKLEGYGETPSGKVFFVIQDNYLLIAGGLMAVIVLLLSIAFVRKQKRLASAPIVGGAAVVLIVLALLINFFSAPQLGIIANPSTYLMAGPSAGAPVIGIVGEGHQVEITGQKDVWTRVKWMDKEAFVREGSLLREKL
jgi:hypothetical protein